MVLVLLLSVSSSSCRCSNDLQEEPETELVTRASRCFRRVMWPQGEQLMDHVRVSPCSCARLCFWGFSSCIISSGKCCPPFCNSEFFSWQIKEMLVICYLKIRNILHLKKKLSLDQSFVHFGCSSLTVARRMRGVFVKSSGFFKPSDWNHILWASHQWQDCHLVVNCLSDCMWLAD